MVRTRCKAALALTLAGLTCGLLSACTSQAGSGSELPPEPDAASTEPVRRVSVDSATAVRLRQIADASVETAARSFGPGDGPSLEVLGARLYRTRGCVECHGPGADPRLGPDLTDAFGTLRELEGRSPLLMDLDYINASLMRPDLLLAKGYPRGKMPSYEGTLYPREVLAIAVYLQSISSPPLMETRAGDVTPIPASTQVPRLDSPLAMEGGPDREPEVTLAAEEPVSSDPAVPRSERTDGRPDWWFDGVRRFDGRVWTCVEALGPTFAKARSELVSKGQDTLAERISLDPDRALRDPRVAYIWVTPLPNRGGAQRYVGYAMISALAEE